MGWVRKREGKEAVEQSTEIKSDLGIRNKSKRLGSYTFRPRINSSSNSKASSLFTSYQLSMPSIKRRLNRV